MHRAYHQRTQNATVPLMKLLGQLGSHPPFQISAFVGSRSCMKLHEAGSNLCCTTLQIHTADSLSLLALSRLCYLIWVLLSSWNLNSQLLHSEYSTTSPHQVLTWNFVAISSSISLHTTSPQAPRKIVLAFNLFLSIKGPIVFPAVADR